MAEIVLIPESAISMVSCLGKTHNLPRVIKTKCQLAGCVFFFFFFPFPFTSRSSILPWPLSLLCGSVGHTIALKALVFFYLLLHHSGKLVFGLFGFICSVPSDTRLQSNNRSTHPVAHLWRSTTYLFCLCFFGSRVIYLQVSMNDGLSFISSNVHITTTECVSGSFLFCFCSFKMIECS